MYTYYKWNFKNYDLFITYTQHNTGTSDTPKVLYSHYTDQFCLL